MPHEIPQPNREIGDKGIVRAFASVVDFGLTGDLELDPPVAEGEPRYMTPAPGYPAVPAQVMQAIQRSKNPTESLAEFYEARAFAVLDGGLNPLRVDAAAYLSASDRIFESNAVSSEALAEHKVRVARQLRAHGLEIAAARYER